MIPIYMLWLPILFSTIAVMVASSVAYMVLPHHKADYGPVPDEEAVRGALRGAAPGLYNVPNVPSRDALKDPEFARKFEEGPLAFLTVLPNGVPNMGKATLQWVIYLLLVSATVAYIGSRSFARGAPFYLVFQVLGTVTFLAYGTALVRESVWYGRPWKDVWKNLADAFVFGAITGAIFAGLWPGG